MKTEKTTTSSREVSSPKRTGGRRKASTQGGDDQKELRADQDGEGRAADMGTPMTVNQTLVSNSIQCKHQELLYIKTREDRIFVFCVALYSFFTYSAISGSWCLPFKILSVLAFVALAWAFQFFLREGSFRKRALLDRIKSLENTMDAPTFQFLNEVDGYSALGYWKEDFYLAFMKISAAIFSLVILFS